MLPMGLPVLHVLHGKGEITADHLGRRAIDPPAVVFIRAAPP
jgi:hypothetical protein